MGRLAALGSNRLCDGREFELGIRTVRGIRLLEELPNNGADGGIRPPPHYEGVLIRIIEDLALPTIWITNHGDDIDPAIRRRIDLAIRFPELPHRARRKLLERALSQAVNRQDWMEPLERAGQLTPARIDQAERGASLSTDNDAERHTQIFRQVMEENLDLGCQGQPDGQRQNEALPYRLDMVNAD